jgi:DNA-binding NarL/FixJ family response regulator
MITQLLVADSDPFVLEGCHRYFSNRGYQVEVAADGLRCLDALRQLPPDVLVLEQELVWGGGDGVLACLREDHSRWPETVIVTTSAAAGQPLPVVHPPLKAVVRKPCSLATLFEAIRQAHWGETQLAARFLRYTQQISALEQRRREHGPAYRIPPRFPDSLWERGS